MGTVCVCLSLWGFLIIDNQKTPQANTYALRSQPRSNTQFVKFCAPVPRRVVCVCVFLYLCINFIYLFIYLLILFIYSFIFLFYLFILLIIN